MATVIGDAKIRVILDVEDAKRQLAQERKAAGSGPGAMGTSSPTAAPSSAAPSSSPSQKPEREKLTISGIERERLLRELSDYWKRRDAMYDRIKNRSAKSQVSGDSDDANMSSLPGGGILSPAKKLIGATANAFGLGPEATAAAKYGAGALAVYGAASFIGSNLNSVIEAIKPSLPGAIKDSGALATVEQALEELRGGFIRLESAVATILSSGMATTEQMGSGALMTGQLPDALSLWNMNWQVERSQRGLDEKLKHERRDDIGAALGDVMAKNFKASLTR